MKKKRKHTAPAPGDLVGEGASKKRAEHGCNTIGAAVVAYDLRPHARLDNHADHGESACGDASAAKSCDGPAHNQCRRVLSDAADQTAELEDDNGSDEEILQGKILEGLSPSRLKATERHKVC